MENNEIIKALKCCKSAVSSCEECPMYIKGVICHGYELNGKALNLILHQQAEIERLKSLVDDHLWDFCSIAGCEEASNDCWKTCSDSRYNKIKAEAERILNQKIVNQSKEIKRLRKCLNDTTQSRNCWKNKAKRIGKQLQQILDDMRKGYDWK